MLEECRILGIQHAYSKEMFFFILENPNFQSLRLCFLLSIHASRGALISLVGGSCSSSPVFLSFQSSSQTSTVVLQFPEGAQGSMTSGSLVTSLIRCSTSLSLLFCKRRYRSFPCSKEVWAYGGSRGQLLQGKGKSNWISDIALLNSTAQGLSLVSSLSWWPILSLNSRAPTCALFSLPLLKGDKLVTLAILTPQRCCSAHKEHRLWHY